MNTRTKSIGIIGGSGINLAKAVADLAQSHPDVVIITSENPPVPTIEVGGIHYREKEQRTSRGGGRLAAMAAMMVPLAYGGPAYSRSNPEVNLVDEYRLIQAKQSKLCRRDREWVVQQFHRHFTPVK